MHGCVLIPFGGGREGEGIGPILPLENTGDEIKTSTVLASSKLSSPEKQNKTKQPKPTEEITLMVTKRREKKPPTTTTKTLF